MELTPIVHHGYTPSDSDERGLWQTCDELEEAIAHSNMLVKDEALTSYVKGVVARLLPEEASDVRTYVVRDPDFNASMAPNGMLLVHTGLLARMRNEAQLAAVLGHESGHYLRRHSLRSWRDRRTKTAVMSFLAIAGAGATAATGTNWYDLANAINNTLLLSLFQFSREMESEADAFGLRLMREAGYSTRAASQVWAQLIAERKASAAARKKKYKDPARSSLSTHPPSEERMSDLVQSAQELQSAGHDRKSTDGREEWLAAIAKSRSMLIDEQVKLNDPGASLFLLDSLAQDGWDGTLRYYQGEVYRLRDEPGDGERAAAAYAESVHLPNPPPEAYRANGYALVKAGDVQAGHEALARYLQLRPDAPDAAMVKFSLAQ